MLTLSLLRHAKSSWDDATVDDFDRPLASRGREAAVAIGGYLGKARLRPNLILCSGATRTRDTLACVLPLIEPPEPIVIFDDRLYMADPAAMLERVAKVDQAYRHVMLIGHNPGIHALTVRLAGGGERAAFDALAVKFPTAALAVLTFNAKSWSRVKPASGHLAHFVTPRLLTER